MKVQIKDYIEKNIPGLKDKLYPIFTTEMDGVSVVYKVSPQTQGHINESQLELKIIHSNYDYCIAVEEQITQLLGFEEDAPFVSLDGLRFRSELAGGGCLYNDGCQKFENTLYFTIDWRKIK